MTIENRVTDNPLYLNDELLAKLGEKFHFPLYAFDEGTIRTFAKEIKDAISYKKFFPRYALKALTIGAVLEVIKSEGFGADASSINEVHRALRAGFEPGDIYYTGEGADVSVYRFLVENDILVNCTSIDQIRLLGRAGGKRCSLRLNPGEGDGESNKTNTGGPSSKHGVYYTEIDDARRVAAEEGIAIIGVHSHIGSGTNLPKWLKIKDKTLDMARHFPDLQIVNLGGGLPVIYEVSKDVGMPLREWGEALSAAMEAFSESLGRDIELQIEPGRYLVASAGVLLAQAQAVKATKNVSGEIAYNFVIVNTGLNHNIRPSLYGSYHPIRFVSSDGSPRGVERDYVVAGYLCESGDVFTIDENSVLVPRSLPEVRVGDIMVMGGVGAYSHSMKSEYNSMNLPASVLVGQDGHVRVIERRGTLHDVMRRELEAYDDSTF